MAFHMPHFLACLARPFNSSARLAVAPDTAGGAAATATASSPQLCTVAAGCFWGVEHLYRKHFANKGLLDAKVGYTGGKTDHPSYATVCRGNTGHAEATQLVFDPSLLSYWKLLEFFYRMHDPTTPALQGPDQGPQYRSAIFFHDAEQERIAREVTAQVNAQWWHGAVVTELLPAAAWWPAETSHQLYLERNPGGYECPSHHLRNFPPLQ